jgi:hypothetical protein
MPAVQTRQSTPRQSTTRCRDRRCNDPNYEPYVQETLEKLEKVATNEYSSFRKASRDHRGECIVNAALSGLGLINKLYLILTQIRLNFGCGGVAADYGKQQPWPLIMVSSCWLR